MSSLYTKMAKGATWMVLFKLSDRGIGLVSMVVLARLLIPADFGLVALATAVIAVLEILGAFNFDIALIQRKDSDHSYYDTAWTFNLIVGVGAGAVVFALAAPAAHFYGEPRLADVMRALSLAPIASSLENIGIVAFRKDMHFQKEFAFLILKRVISSATTLILALIWKNYWALAIGILAGRLAGTTLSYALNDYRPSPSLRRRAELMHFSFWLFFNNILAFISNRSSDFIIGKTAGASALGIYSLASEISNLPTTDLVSPVNRAVFPAYAKMSHDRTELGRGYLRVVGLITLLTIPAALGIAATSSVLVPLVFGPKWLGAVALIQVIAYYGIFQALQNNVPSVYYALGKPQLTTFIACVYNVIMVPSLIAFSLRWGSLGASYALLVSIAIVAPINLGVVLRLLKLPVLKLVAEIWRPLTAGGLMLAFVEMLKAYLPMLLTHASLILTLLILMLAGLVVYVTVLLLLWAAAGKPDGAERTTLDLLWRRLKSRAPRP